MALIKFQDILKLAKPYRSQLYKFLIFNILTSIFNVVSIGMVIPFLKVIFRKNPEVVPTKFFLSRNSLPIKRSNFFKTT